MRTFCQHMKSDETYIFKCHSSVCRLVPLLHNLCSDYKFIFTSRRDIEAAVLSVDRAITSNCIPTFCLSILQVCPTLAFAIVPKLRSRFESLMKIRPKSQLSFSFIFYSTPYKYYFENKHLFSYHMFYEDLVGAAEQELSKIFKIIGIPLDFIPDAVTRLAIDSQGSTPWAKSRRDNNTCRKISPEDWLEFGKIAKKLSLPSEYIECLPN